MASFDKGSSNDVTATVPALSSLSTGKDLWTLMSDHQEAERKSGVRSTTESFHIKGVERLR